MKFSPDWECLIDSCKALYLSVLWSFTVKFILYNTNQPEQHVTVTANSDLGLKIATKFTINNLMKDVLKLTSWVLAGRC